MKTLPIHQQLVLVQLGPGFDEATLAGRQLTRDQVDRLDGEHGHPIYLDRADARRTTRKLVQRLEHLGYDVQITRKAA